MSNGCVNLAIGEDSNPLSPLPVPRNSEHLRPCIHV